MNGYRRQHPPYAIHNGTFVRSSKFMEVSLSVLNLHILGNGPLYVNDDDKCYPRGWLRRAGLAQSVMEEKVTYRAMVEILNKWPFIISRSTFAGSGRLGSRRAIGSAITGARGYSVQGVCIGRWPAHRYAGGCATVSDTPDPVCGTKHMRLIGRRNGGAVQRLDAALGVHDVLPEPQRDVGARKSHTIGPALRPRTHPLFHASSLGKYGLK